METDTWEYDCNVQITSWCLGPVVLVIYPAHQIQAHVTNQEVCSSTGQPPVTSLVKLRHLKLFGHFCPSRTDLRPWTHTASFHQSSPWGLASPKTSSTLVSAMNSRSWSQATQLWHPYSMSVRGRSFHLAECRGNSHALGRMRHLMMMMKRTPVSYPWQFYYCIDANSFTYKLVKRLIVIESINSYCHPMQVSQL